MTVIINGTTGIDTVQDDSVDIPTLSATGTPSASTYLRGDNSWATVAGYTNSDALTLFNASGSAPVYACRAWVNFNGRSTVTIRNSANVSSITDNGTGQYTVNFTTAMVDANYATLINSSEAQSINMAATWSGGVDQSTSSFKIYIRGGGNVATDPTYVSAAVFR